MAETLNSQADDNSNVGVLWYHQFSYTTEQNPNASDIITFPGPPCRQFLFAKIGNSRVYIWDLMILIPNVIFFLFLLFKMRRICIKVGRNDSPIFSVCVILVCLANVISLVRCVVSMCISVPLSTSDRVIWLLLRFFLLATELSVILFGFMFGHLDSRRSIQRVLFVTFAVALIYSLTQGSLEFFSPNHTFHNITIKPGSTYYLFGHGGMMFWFISSVLLSVVYFTVCILPLTAFPRHFAIPTRFSFYVYCAVLALLNAAQSVGCGLLYFINESSGWCIVDATAYLYFAGFAPLIYGTFLRNFFAYTQRPKLSFSYQTHADEPGGGDEPDLPYQPALTQPPMSINAAEDELAVDVEGATGNEFESARSQQPLLLGWRHLHDVFVGIPEVKTLPRRSVGSRTPSPPYSRDEERH